MARYLALAPGIYMAKVRNDIVVLDVGADSYSCIVEGGHWLEPTGRGTVRLFDEVLADDLEASGLVKSQGEPQVAFLPPKAVAEFPSDHHSSVGLRIDTAARAVVATALFRRSTLSRLVEPRSPRCRKGIAHVLPQTAKRISAYRAVLPYLPFEGLCLQRAFQLKRLLEDDGQTVSWVFGVRTWPFFAHCWLQIDEFVVGDRIARVGAFTPIAVF